MTSEYARGVERVGESAGATYVMEEQVGFCLRRAHQRATEIFTDVMAEFAVTPTQFAALVQLEQKGPLSQNLLGRFTAMDPSTIFGVVSRLMKRGLVTQSVDTADARLVVISLTADGAALARQMRAVAPRVTHRTLEPLTTDEAATFLELLKKLG